MILDLLMAAANVGGGASGTGVVGSTTFKGTTPSLTWSITCPAETQVGDILLYVVSSTDANAPSSIAGGSSLLAQVGMNISYKRATAADIPGVTTYSSSTSSGSTIISANLIAIRGVVGNPIIGTSNTGTVGSTTITAASVNSASPSLAIGVFGNRVSTSDTYTLPADTTLIEDLNGTAALLTCWRAFTSGASGAMTSTSINTTVSRRVVQTAMVLSAMP